MIEDTRRYARIALMRVVEQPSAAFTMPFAVRPLIADDVEQSSEIERDAFPTLFPPTSFRRELKNKRASYLVAVVRPPDERLLPNPVVLRQPAGTSHRDVPTPVRTRLSRALWPKRHTRNGAYSDVIAGFEGTWYMADEAHIVTVGVGREYRGKGIGELLLIAALEHAVDRGSTFATLEVRPSNQVARTLYLKYGFTERGVRKSYYSDNREDAIIMTTDPIQLSEFQDQLDDLKRDHEVRWGQAAIAVE